MPNNYQRKGDEVLVNTVTAGDQGETSIASRQDGGFIVVWTDESAQGNDTSLAGIKAQRFDADGNKVGSEFSVNTTTFGFQFRPSVVELVSGKFVVTWTDTNAPNTSFTNSDVRGQMFNVNGTPSGSEFVLSTNNGGSQVGAPAMVTALAGGGFVATWSDTSGVGGDTSFRGIKAQLFDANGGKVGDEFLANTVTDGGQAVVSVTSLTGGGFAISWNNVPIGGQSSISVQLFDDLGAKIGPERVASTDNTGNVEFSSIAALDTGFVVIWAHAAGNEHDIKAQRFDAAGAKVGGEILVNTDLPGDQLWSDVTGLPGGGFLVTWESFQQQGPDSNVRAQVFDADGVKVGGEFTVSGVTDGFQSLPRIATLASGEAVVIWIDDSGVGGDTSGSGIKMQILAPVGGATEGDDILTGTPGDDDIQGLGGNDVINGLAGNDSMSGGRGNDLYIVDSVGDAVIELPGEGVDIIYSAVSYALNDTSEVENLSTITWENSDPLNLTGNSLANTLIGNAGANQLNGAGGADIMFGREGNDIYIVDSAGDQAIELAGQGSDIVYSAVSYALNDASQVESLATLSFEGTASLNLTGNGLANTLIGNDGNNQLDGKGGADVMVGRAGGDIYLVDHATDAVFENSNGGYDVIYSAVSFALTNDQEIEGLSTITWELTDSIDLTGNASGNYLIGNAGQNRLDGGGGRDFLYGLGGADSFAFTTALGGGNVDLLGDFSAADDTILLENAVFTGLVAGSLDPNAFVIGAAAADADDRIVYDQATGRLFFDADGNGNGAAVQFATLEGAPIIAAGDFMVI